MDEYLKSKIRATIEDAADYGSRRLFKNTKGDDKTIEFFVNEIVDAIIETYCKPVSNMSNVKSTKAYECDDVWYREDGTMIGIQMKITEIED